MRSKIGRVVPFRSCQHSREREIEGRKPALAPPMTGSFSSFGEINRPLPSQNHTTFGILQKERGKKIPWELQELRQDGETPAFQKMELSSGLPLPSSTPEGKGQTMLRKSLSGDLRGHTATGRKI